MRNITTTHAPAPTHSGSPSVASASLQLQERDVAMVDAVHRHRVLSTEQLAALFFPTANGQVNSACRTRLRRLAKAGFVERAEQLQARSDGRRPYLYMLAAAGKELLIEEVGYEAEEVDWRPAYNNVRWPFLAHQLAINDAYVAVALAARRLGWYIERWVDDRILRQQHARRATASGAGAAVVPDAYFTLVSSAAHLHFFLEIDRATMSVVTASRQAKSWRGRIAAYQDYFVSPAIVEQYGTRRIRVLTVTTGSRRLAHLKRATEQVGGRRRYWFAVADALSPATALLHPIWQVASSDTAHTLLSRP